MARSRRRSHGDEAVELLGEVTAPSGILLVLDMGLLNLWCHDRPPTMPEGVLGEESAASANAAGDFRIEEPNAERAGRAYDRQWHPLYLFDIPGQAVDDFRERFDRFAGEHGF